MEFRVQRTTALLDAPNGQTVDVLSPNDHLTGTGQTSGDFTQVTTDDNRHGWVKTADCSPIGEEPLPPLDKGDFVSQCVAVEGAFNNVDGVAPWFVSADYLIATAIIETDLSNVGPKIPGSDATGPLQVTSAQWTDFLQSGNPLAAQFRPGDFKNPILQVFGAAFRMHINAKAISALKTPAGAKDVFVPNYLNLLHADLTGGAKAAVAILDASQSDVDKTKPVDAILKTALSDAQVAGVFKAYARFTGPEGQPNTVASFVQATENALADALKQAFDLIQQFVPEEVPTVRQGEALWFDVAQKEEAAGIAEPDQQILTYFQPTDFRPIPTSTDTPWCGAFAAFCMAQSGAPAALASIPKASARAASWKSWGTPLPLKSDNIPPGAVVVFSPGEGTGGSGHVSFFVGFTPDGKFVQVLGGNQSNRVKKSNFPVSQIAAIRWLDLAPALIAEQNGAAPSASPISKIAFDLIVESEVTSEQHYTKLLRAPEWPGESSGVTIGIGYDVGQTAAEIFQSDWRNELDDVMFDALKQTVGTTGRPAKALAAALKNVVDIPWVKALKVHTDCVMPRWVGVVKAKLPNTDLLHRDSLGALVSLTYNRGSGGYTNPDSRYDEMRSIKAAMAAQNFAAIPDLIRQMKRLWPGVPGLLTRRDKEAALFASGLV